MPKGICTHWLSGGSPDFERFSLAHKKGFVTALTPLSYPARPEPTGLGLGE